MSKQEEIDEILKLFKKFDVFSISSHINPDGDAIGSQIAIYSLLLDFGKKVYILNSDPIPFTYNFLPYIDNYQWGDCVENYPSNIDVAIILDCGNMKRIGERLANKTKPKHAIVNIDHHLNNSYFGTHNLVDEKACATSELVFNLIDQSGIGLGYERAISLYSGIITDTGSFKYKNTTAQAHIITAKLIEEGIQPDFVAEMIYSVIPYKKAKLFGLALESLTLSEDGKIAWISISKEMFKKTGTSSADTDEFIDYVRSVKDIQVAIMFKENENGSVKVSLRSKNSKMGSYVSVDQIASAFGGGGHQMAAGCVVPGPLNSAINTIIKAVSDLLSSLG